MADHHNVDPRFPHHHPRPQSFWEARANALQSLLIEKGLLSSDAIERVVHHYEHELGPMHGAKVVAKAWTTLPVPALRSYWICRKLNPGLFVQKVLLTPHATPR